MLTLKYVGPRVEINQHGVFYKDGKADKFIYIAMAAIILKNLDTDHSKKVYEIDNKISIDDKETLSLVANYIPNIEEIMTKEIENYLIYLEDEKQDVLNNQNITALEQDIWIKNLDIMKDYRIQRRKNKIFYMHIIETIVLLIKKYQIKELNIIFCEKTWHIFETISNKLKEGIQGDSNKLDTFCKNDILLIRLENI